MKAFLFIFSFVFFGFLLASPFSQAEIVENPDSENLTPTTTHSSSTENEEKYLEIKTTNQEEIPPSSEKTEPAKLLSKLKQQRIINLSTNISNRLDASVFRHKQISERIDSRLNKLSDLGFDTEEARGLLETIKQKNQETETALKDIDTIVYEAITTTDPKKNWKKVKSIYELSAAKITENQNHLRHLLSLLKNLSEKPETTENNN